MAETNLAARLRDASIGAIATVIVGALTLAGAYVTGWFTYASKDEELKVHLVEIAIGILRADPKEDVTPARGWAVEVINHCSGVTFSAEDRAALLHKPIKANIWSWDDTGKMEDIMRKNGNIPQPIPAPTK